MAWGILRRTPHHVRTSVEIQKQDPQTGIARADGVRSGDKRYPLLRLGIFSLPISMQSKTESKAMFDQLNNAVYDVGEGEERQCLGFYKSALVICDGQTMRPVTVAQSIEWLLGITRDEQAGVYEYSDGSYQGRITWLVMALAALAV